MMSPKTASNSRPSLAIGESFTRIRVPHNLAGLLALPHIFREILTPHIQGIYQAENYAAAGWKLRKSELCEKRSFLVDLRQPPHHQIVTRT